jgi:nitrogen regulatory protein PII
MTLRAIIAADLDDVFFDVDEFAESITYNGTTIMAIVEYGKQRAKDAIVFDAEILVKASDVPIPTYRDTVVIDGVTFKVLQDAESQPSGDGFTWRIPVMRNERAPVGERRR